MKGDMIAGAMGVVVGIAVSFGALQLSIGTTTQPQPGFFPLVAGIAVAVLSLILIVRALRERRVEGAGWGAVRRPVFLIAGLGVYVAVLDPLGYVPATMFLSGTLLRVLGGTSWRVVSIVSVTLAVATYLVFARLLGIDLPAGLLRGAG